MKNESIANLDRFLNADIKEQRYLTLFIIFVIILAYNVMLHIFTQNPNNTGDIQYYWFAGDTFIKNGKFSIWNFYHGFPYANWPFVSFRGYLIPLITLGIRSLAAVIHIHYDFIYLPITSLAMALVFTYLIPGIYQIATDRKVKVWQTILFFLLVSFFWRGFYFYLLLDVYGFFAFLLTFYFSVRYLKNPSGTTYLDYFVWGVAAAVAIQLRSAFILGMVMSVFCLMMVWVKRIIEHVKAEGVNSKIIVWFIAPALGLGLFFAGLILVEIPQFIINWDAGYPWKLFPFDNKNGLFLRSAVISFIFHTLNPYIVIDQNGLAFLKQYFMLPLNSPVDDVMKAVQFNSFIDLFVLWIKHPFQMVANYFQKFFNGMDIRFSNPYPIHRGDLRYLEVFSVMLVNYTLLYTGLLTLINSWRMKLLGTYEKFLFFMILMFVGVQVILHIEWRYFFPGYFMLYYLIVFHVKDLKGFFNVREGRNWKIAFFSLLYLQFMGACVWLGMDVSRQLNANLPIRYLFGLW